MRIVLSLFADYALAHETDGKLYVTGGGLRVLSFPAFPATQRQLALALGIEVPPEQLNSPHTLSIERLMPPESPAPDPPLTPVQVTFTLPSADERSESGHLNVVSNMDNIVFPVPGDYTFSIAIDGRHVHDAHIRTRVSGEAVPAAAQLVEGYHAFEAGEHDRAEAIFRDVVTRFPTVPGGYNNLGFVRLAQGDARGALQSFVKARELGYEYTEITFANIACAMYLAGDYKAASQLFETCLEQPALRATGMLFGINDESLFPVAYKSVGEYVNLMSLNAAWSALRVSARDRALQLLNAARTSSLAARDDDSGRSYMQSIRSLDARLEKEVSPSPSP
jgi:hypothetical protein